MHAQGTQKSEVSPVDGGKEENFGAPLSAKGKKEKSWGPLPRHFALAWKPPMLVGCRLVEERSRPWRGEEIAPRPPFCVYLVLEGGAGRAPIL